jgi:hypothetical protein
MPANIGSAKIYQFPARGRFATGAARDDSKPAMTLASPRVARAVSGSSWYHEDAIREADSARDQ